MKSSILFFVFFLSFLLSFCSCIAQKLYSIYKWSACQMIALLSEIFLFLVRAACELRLASYFSKHALQSPSDTPFCAYLYAQFQTKRSHKDVLPFKQLLYFWRYLFSVAELYTRYDWWLMGPNTHCNLFPMRHFVRTYTHNSKKYR